MDHENTVDDLKNIVRKFCDARDWEKYHNPKDLSIGIITEASELIELFRFKDLDEVEELLENIKSRENIKQELADVLFFVLRFAQMNDIDLSKALKNKVEINENKYPADLFKGSNKKYNEL